MSKAIEVNCLVMMVRGHSCLLRRHGGIPYVVERIVLPTGGGWTCGYCKERSAGSNEPAAFVANKTGGIPVSWLIRLDAPTESESTEGREEVRA